MESARTVLAAAPEKDRQEAIRTAVNLALEGETREDLLVRMLPMGRYTYVMIHLLEPPDPPADGVRHWDAARSRLAAELRAVDERCLFDLIVTSKRWWMNDTVLEPPEEYATPRGKG